MRKKTGLFFVWVGAIAAVVGLFASTVTRSGDVLLVGGILLVLWGGLVWKLGR